MNKNLVFDLGMHHAKDSEFYLGKGFSVVALEANPVMTSAAERRFADMVASGQFHVVNKALWEKDGETISFFVNPTKDDWSSVKKAWAEKGGHSSHEIVVQSLTLSALLQQFGVPYYIKCDIEGADELFVEQLIKEDAKPAFVSVEAISVTVLKKLRAAGYDSFQIVNQALLGAIPAPNPPREGTFVDAKFNGHMSGLFGRELDPGKWVSFDEAMERYTMFVALWRKDPMLAHGWLDFHAGQSRFLA